MSKCGDTMIEGAQNLVGHEALFRFLGFFLTFSAVALAELKWPRRTPSSNKARRWRKNLLLIATDVVCVRIVFPMSFIYLAYSANQSGWGLLNYIELPPLAEFLLGFFALDLVIYLQHLMFHAVPLLWRLHMVHHADMDIDVTTGLRFHPMEILLSALVKAGAIAALGPSPLAVFAFEVALNATALFNHGNFSIPVGIDRILRLFVVTPDMHRVHHSVTIRETNSNFGFNLPWWDRLFGTYRAQPVMGHTGMTIGVSHIRDEASLGLWGLLTLPFTTDQGPYPINRSGADPSILKGKKG